MKSPSSFPALQQTTCALYPHSQLSSLLWTHSASPSYNIPIPKCQLPMCQNTFYPEPLVDTPKRIPEFPTRIQTLHPPKNQRGEQKSKEKSLIQQRQDHTHTSIWNYNHPRPRCLDTSEKNTMNNN